ncbi:MAG: 4Fe-4S dicluster domain-containing protein [Geobacteraceae bacterium]|nr:4Fe-4S dicluster domain-containing protein [Geobacteraceae bacterium]
MKLSERVVDLFHKIPNGKKEKIMGTHHITDNCIACGACEPVCPVSAISSGDPIYVIDMDVCIECGACDDVCPVEAIEWEKKSS